MTYQCSQEGWVTRLRRCQAGPLHCGPIFELRCLGCHFNDCLTMFWHFRHCQAAWHGHPFWVGATDALVPRSHVSQSKTLVDSSIPSLPRSSRNLTSFFAKVLLSFFGLFFLVLCPGLLFCVFLNVKCKMSMWCWYFPHMFMSRLFCIVFRVQLLASQRQLSGSQSPS